ncbi:MAG: vWA domain-containing protein [Bdellovibrionales bacterium]
MTFAFSYAFLLIIPLFLFACYFLFFKNKKQASFRYSFLEALPKNYFSLRESLSPLPKILKILALLFVIVALARPQTIKEQSEQNVKGIDIMIVMDVSLSMLVKDMGRGLTRLEAAKKVVSNFIQGRVSDRIGLILFSGESFTKVPLTLDYDLVLKNLAEVQSISEIRQGTAIGVALANAAVRLKHSSPESRVIVFLTDGENNTGFIDPETALKIVRKNKIKVYTVGLGSVGGKDSIVFETKDAYGRKIRQRAYVNSRINKKLMKKMAEQTKGEFFMAKNLTSLQNIFNRINELEKQDIQVHKWMEYKEHFSYFLKIGIIFYAVSLFLSLSLFFRGV